MRARRIFLGALLVAAFGPSSLASAATAKLLLSAGEVRLTRRPNGRFWLAVGVGGGARLLVGGSLVVADDGARLTGGPRGALRLTEGARLALYGRGSLETPVGWVVEVEEDGALLLERGTLHLLNGRARLTPPGRSPRRARSLTGPAQISLGLDGRAARLGWDGAAAAQLEAALLRAARGAPARWDPAVSQPTAGQARRMVQLGRQRQQAARETASCGCTEGQTGDASGNATQGPANQPLENRNATIRVRVRGVPARGGAR